MIISFEIEDLLRTASQLKRREKEKQRSRRALCKNPACRQAGPYLLFSALKSQ